MAAPRAELQVFRSARERNTECGCRVGAGCRIRTDDLRFTRALLYQLS